MNNTSSGEFVSGLQDAIRQNPVSAALIGMGVLWMFTGGAKLSTATALLSPAARAAANSIGSGVEASTAAVGAVTESVRSVGSRVADGLRNTLSDSAASVSETATEAYDAAKDAVSDSTSSAQTTRNAQARDAAGLARVVQDNLKDTFERQPLLLGAIGIAIGAGMAAGLPTTQTETEFAGDAADRVKAQAQEFASEQADRVTDTAKRTLEAVKQEAAAQGLTPAAAKEAAATAGEKIKTVAQAARGRTRTERGPA